MATIVLAFPLHRPKRSMNSFHYFFLYIFSLIDLESQSNQISGLKLPWAGRKNNRNNKIRRRQVASASSPDGSIVGKYATYDEVNDPRGPVFVDRGDPG